MKPIQWNFDPAATGPRWRLFLSEYWQIMVYETGHWLVMKGGARIRAGGEAGSLRAGKISAIKICRALRRLTPDVLMALGA